jgi:hypothetical protein
MIDFPANPQVGDVFQNWAWDGVKWASPGLPGPPGPEGPPGEDGAPGPGAGANRIINGDMKINQRSGLVDEFLPSGYVIDRWNFQSNFPLQTGYWQQIVATNFDLYNGSGAYLIYRTFTPHALVAGEYAMFYQSIEAGLVSDFAWGADQAQPITVSFWATSSETSLFSGSIRNENKAATNPNSRSYPFTFTLPSPGVWNRVVVTIPGDTDSNAEWLLTGSGGALSLCICLGEGGTFQAAAGAWIDANCVGASGTTDLCAITNAYFAFTSVKLELGSVATPFIPEPPAKALGDCQRYYQLIKGGPDVGIQGYGLAGGPCSCTIGYTPMRDKPGASLVGNWIDFPSGNISSCNLYAGEQSMLFQILPAASGTFSLYASDDTGGIALDAEI